ncbi:MAG: nucleoside hydrolase [Verrucomicrobiota bacterium]
MKRKVIIDQDAFGPSGSNLQSILMVLQSPNVEVLGITVVSGDGWVKENVSHVLRMLELIDRPEVPVVPGATFPLIATQESTRRWETLYGKLPYKGAWMESWPEYNTVHRPPYHAPEIVPPSPLGAPTLAPASETAAAFLTRKVREFPGEVSVLAMGPFTNLALAARLDDSFAANARELVFMGGSFSPVVSTIDEFSLQFVHSPRVEFNCRWDPEAAHIMLHAGWKKITCIPLDATAATKLTPELVRRAGAGEGAAARYFRQHPSLGYPMWDEIAAAVLLDPTLPTETLALAMDIEIDHGASYGATLSWPVNAGPGLGEPAVTVVRAIDVPRLEALFVALLQRSS